MRPQEAAEPYREVIQAAVARGLTAQRIWQDLKEEYGLSKTGVGLQADDALLLPHSKQIYLS